VFVPWISPTIGTYDCSSIVTTWKLYKSLYNVMYIVYVLLMTRTASMLDTLL